MARPKGKQNTKLEDKVYVFVACEGETEQNYFKKVVQFYLNTNGASHVRLTVDKRSKISEIENVMKRSPYKFKKVLYVTDLDVCDEPGKGKAVIAHLGKEIEGKVRETARQKNEQWETVYSYPTIEFWYLLHQEALTRPFGTAKEVLAAFVRRCKWYKKPMPRDENESKWFLDRVDVAIKNEKKVSSSDVLKYSFQIRPNNPKLTNPMSEIGSAISDLLNLTVT